jgi:catechol 2,3-dioxygenase-like lactoylglutathione lyase family enzyme
MISRIHSTTIIVADQDASLDFFVKTLGWKKSIDNMMGPTMRFLTVVPPGAQTELVLATAGWMGPGSNLKSGYTGISLVSPDIEATYETLKKKGVKFKGPLETMPWGAKAAWFYDIDGNEFFLAAEQ